MQHRRIDEAEARRAYLLGQRVKLRREALGLTQGQVATYAGVSGAFVSRIERGLVPHASAEKLSLVARALRCSLADLTGGEAPITSGPLAALEVEPEKIPWLRRFAALTSTELERAWRAVDAFYGQPGEGSPEERQRYEVIEHHARA